MRRALFLTSLSAIATVPLLSVPARAQVATFDAANYAKAIDELQQQGFIAASTASSAERELSSLQQLASMNQLNVGSLYNLAIPYITDIVNAAQLNVKIPLTADQLLIQFANAFPSWNPTGPYAAIYQSAITGARKAMVTAIQESQMIDNQVGKQDQTIATLIKTPPASIKDSMAISNVLAANVVASVNSLQSTMGHQFNDQGQFLSGMYASQEALRRSPGMATLISTFSALPARLQNVKQ